MAEDPIIDADGHVEPAVVVDWTRYVPSPHADVLIRHARAMYSAYGDITARRKGMWDPHARVIDMDEEAIDVAVLFGGLVGIDAVADPDDPRCEIATARGYNDWLAEYCQSYPDRLKGVACLPFGDIQAACKELERAVTQLGFISAVLPVDHGDHGLDDPYFAPVHQTAQQLDVALTVHAPGMYGQAYERRWYTHFRKHAFGFTAGLLAGTMDVLCGGVLERYPSLRIGFLEAGCGWLPYWLERLDEHYEHLPFQAPAIDRPPSAHLDSGRFFVSCEPDEKTLPYVLSVVGDELIVYASDYAHYDCLYPDSARVIQRRGDLSEESKRKLLGANATRLYKLG